MLFIDHETCTGCATCAQECYRDCFTMEDGAVVYDSAMCNMCGHCMSVCPCDALYIDGDGYDCEDVVELSFSPRPTPSMMSTLILHRRSVRSFTDTPVTEEQILSILDAGKYAPTGMNAQGNAFIVVSDPEKRKEMTQEIAALMAEKAASLKASNPGLSAYIGGKASKYLEQGKDTILFDAPLVVFVFASSSEDGAFCASTMGFMTQSLGLGYCLAQLPADAFDDEAFAAKWQAPEGKKCVIALLIGEPKFEYFSSVTRKTPPVVRY